MLLSPVIDFRVGETTIPTQFIYDEDEPLEVLAHFNDPNNGMVYWRFDRDLLLSGLWYEIGEGDVKVAKVSDHLISITLTNAETTVTIYGPRPPVYKFCQDMLELVPAGTEDMSSRVDTLIAEILGQTS